MGLLLSPLLLLSFDAGDVDLAKLPRKIAPPKTAKAPKYVCLVFGEKAERVVWLVRDGESLFVDRNSDGDFDDNDEKIAAKASDEGALVRFEAGDLAIPKLDPAELTVTINRSADGKTTERTTVSARIRRAEAPSAESDGRYYCLAYSDLLGGLAFADQIDKATILHFGGPWKLWLADKYSIARSREVEAYLSVGTTGVGPGSFVYVGVDDGAPEKATPVIEFRPGGPTVHIRHRC